MIAALIVPQLEPDTEKNLQIIEKLSLGALSNGAELLVLPEAVLTGLNLSDEHERDINLCETIPGPSVKRLGKFCRAHRCWMAMGLLEKDGNCIYDSAVMLNPAGETALHYRRISSGWRRRDASSEKYGEGNTFKVCFTPFGRVGIIICGDMFEENVIAKVKQASPDILIVPTARSFSDGSHSQERWESEEKEAYSAQIDSYRTPLLMVNYIWKEGQQGDPCFGGAFAFTKSGISLEEHPLGKEGILLVDMEELK